MKDAIQADEAFEKSNKCYQKARETKQEHFEFKARVAYASGFAALLV